eukprot:ANDGO_02498.mRNA.1 hypothetical protein
MAGRLNSLRPRFFVPICCAVGVVGSTFWFNVEEAKNAATVLQRIADVQQRSTSSPADESVRKQAFDGLFQHLEEGVVLAETGPWDWIIESLVREMNRNDISVSYRRFLWEGVLSDVPAIPEVVMDLFSKPEFWESTVFLSNLGMDLHVRYLDAVISLPEFQRLLVDSDFLQNKMTSVFSKLASNSGCLNDPSTSADPRALLCLAATFSILARTSEPYIRLQMRDQLLTTVLPVQQRIAQAASDLPADSSNPYQDSLIKSADAVLAALVMNLQKRHDASQSNTERGTLMTTRTVFPSLVYRNVLLPDTFYDYAGSGLASLASAAYVWFRTRNLRILVPWHRIVLGSAVMASTYSCLVLDRFHRSELLKNDSLTKQTPGARMVSVASLQRTLVWMNLVLSCFVIRGCKFFIPPFVACFFVPWTQFVTDPALHRVLSERETQFVRQHFAEIYPSS